MAWRRPGDKPLFEPMMISLLTHICVTRPQWVKTWRPLLLLHPCIRNNHNALQWLYNECDGVSNYRRLHYLLNILFKRRSKKTSKLHVTGLYVGNSPVTGDFPAQRASNAKNVSIWWRHYWNVIEAALVSALLVVWSCCIDLIRSKRSNH